MCPGVLVVTGGNGTTAARNARNSMDKFQSLADYLGTSPVVDETSEPRLVDITDSKTFCLAVLNSLEFRRFIETGARLGSLPTPIWLRIMDHGWGKPADRVEHTGKDGQPIETVTEVRRVIIHAQRDERSVEEVTPRASALTH